MGKSSWLFVQAKSFEFVFKSSTLFYGFMRDVVEITILEIFASR